MSIYEKWFATEAMCLALGWTLVWFGDEICEDFVCALGSIVAACSLVGAFVTILLEIWR